MYSCADFLREFSDLRDGLMEPDQRAAAESHLAQCAVCSDYVEVVETGIGQLRSLPVIESSDDFLERLQHRIYHLDEERAGWSHRSGSGASTGFVVMLVLLISGAAWLPLARTVPAVVELPPVAVTEPRVVDSVHALFQEGPLLVKDAGSRFDDPIQARVVLLRNSRLGSYSTFRPSFANIR